MDQATLATRVRQQVYEGCLTTGAPPTRAALARTLSVSLPPLDEALAALAAARALVLQPETGEIGMANPFSAVPTPFWVESGGVSGWANCVWDAFGIPAMRAQDATIHCSCPDCGAGYTVRVEGGALATTEGVAHFALPARRWWENIVFT